MPPSNVNGVRTRVLVLIAAAAVISMLVGGSPAQSSNAAATDSLAAWDATLMPNYLPQGDPASLNLQAVWIYPKSPTTPYVSPDSWHEAGRYLLLDPRYNDGHGHQGSDEWWFIIHRYWPTSYAAGNHGAWGSEEDFHNVAGDAGPAGSAGVGWGFGTRVSSLLLSWEPHDSSPCFSVEPNRPRNQYLLPPVSRNAWHTYVVHFIAGRTDGTTLRPGALTVWADGADTPVVDAHGINTVQKAQGPDGNWYVQRWMNLFQGDYTSGLPVSSTVRFALTRIGTTFAQAVSDRPVVNKNNLAGQYYSGNGTNLGPSSLVPAPSLTNPDNLLPSVLTGGSTVTPPASPAPPSSPATAPPPPSPAPAPPVAASTSQPELLLANLASSNEVSCSGCSVSTAGGVLDAAIAGGADSVDTAYRLSDFGGAQGWSGRVFARDVLRIQTGQAINGNLAVFQVRDVNNSVVYELYVDGSSKTIRIWSPPGGLQAASLNRDTGVSVTDGAAHRVEVSARANESLTVRVDDVDRISVGGLSGASTGNQRYLRAGIDHYDTPGTTDAVSVSHSLVGVSARGWLGARAGASDGSQPGAASPPPDAASSAAGGSGSAQEGGSTTVSHGAAGRQASPPSALFSPDAAQGAPQSGRRHVAVARLKRLPVVFGAIVPLGHRTIGVNARTRPNLQVVVTIRARSGRLFGVARTLSDARGRTHVVVGLGRWSGQAKVNVRVTAYGIRRAHRTVRLLSLSPRQVRLLAVR